MKKFKKVLIILVFVIAFAWTVYYINIKLPTYVVRSGTNMSASNYVETSLDIQVYKKFGGKSFYEEIAENHNRLNGTPNRLEMNLYLFDYCYHAGM